MTWHIRRCMWQLKCLHYVDLMWKIMKGNGSIYNCARAMTKIIINPTCKTVVILWWHQSEDNVKNFIYFYFQKGLWMQLEQRCNRRSSQAFIPNLYHQLNNIQIKFYPFHWSPNISLPTTAKFSTKNVIPDAVMLIGIKSYNIQYNHKYINI